MLISEPYFLITPWLFFPRHPPLRPRILPLFASFVLDFRGTTTTPPSSVFGLRCLAPSSSLPSLNLRSCSPRLLAALHPALGCHPLLSLEALSPLCLWPLVTHRLSLHHRRHSSGMRLHQCVRRLRLQGLGPLLRHARELRAEATQLPRREAYWSYRRHDGVHAYSKVECGAVLLVKVWV